MSPPPGLPDPPGEGPGAGADATPVGGRLRLGQAAFASFYADALLAVIGLAVVPYLVSRLGTEPYGILAVVYVLATQMVVLHGGVGTVATRMVADSLGRGGRGLPARLAALAIMTVGACVLVAVSFRFLGPVAWRQGFNLSPAALPVALGAVPAATALLAVTPASAAVYGIMAGREAFLFLAVLRVVQGGGRLLVAAGVVAAGGGVEAVLWAQAGVDALAALSGGLVAWRPRPATGARGRLGTELREAVGLGVPFALVGLLSGLLMDAEKLAIGLARSVEDFTYYAVPFSAVIKFTVLAGAVSRVMVPRLAALGAGGGGEAAALVARADRILLLGMVGVLAPVVAVVPELLELWVSTVDPGLGREFALRSTLPTRILLVGVAVNAAAFPSNALVLGRGRPVLLTLLYAAEVVLHLGVVYVLVSRYGIAGAAAAWAVRALVDTLGQRGLARHTLGRRLGDGGLLWGGFVALAGLAALCTWDPGLGWRMLAGAGLAAVALGWLVRGPDRALLLDSVLPWRWRRR